MASRRRRPPPRIRQEEPADGTKEVVEIFAKFDKNGDGRIFASELAKVLSELGMSTGSVRRLMAEADTDKNHALDYHEFVAWICGRSKAAKELSSHFNLLVLNNRDGQSRVKMDPLHGRSASLYLPNGTLARKVRARGDSWVVRYDGEDWLVRKHYALEGEDKIPGGMEKYTSVESLRSSLVSGDVALVRGPWLLEQAMLQRELPRRQELPEEAVFTSKELEELFTCSAGKDAKLKDGAAIVVISYGWLSADHPDPEGRQLGEYLRLALECHYHQHFTCNQDGSWELLVNAPPLAVFMDWLSLYQNPRTDEQYAAFRRALADMGKWYAHCLTRKWILSVFPPGITAETHPTWNLRAYQDRGWTTFESSVATLITPSAEVWDLGRFPTLAELQSGAMPGRDAVRQRRYDLSTCDKRVVQQPLLTPEEFARLLANKHFSCARKDPDSVNALYAGIFHNITAMPTLSWNGMSLNRSSFQTLRLFWNLKKLFLRDCNLEAVPECLFRHCGLYLQTLDLQFNRLITLPDALGSLANIKAIGSQRSGTRPSHLTEGLLLPTSVTVLPKSMGRMKSVTIIDLSHCHLTSLPEFMGRMKNVTIIDLSHCHLTSLPESMGNMVNVTGISLDGCERLTSLPESMGNMVKLTTLTLRYCSSLTSLPESMGNMVKLTTLDLRDCSSLTSLPESMGNMVKLTTLNLRDCSSLTSLPESMGNMLKAISIDLSGCSGLTSLPE